MRYYSSIAQLAQLSSGVNNLVTSIVVSALTGFPTTCPFTIAVDPSTAYEEIMTVTVVSGTTLTVTRGEDSSTAVSHSAGAGVRHVMSARDLREPQEHITATQNIHGAGVGSSIVGTGTAQTLTNKTIDGAENTIQNLAAAAIGSGVLDGARVPAQAYSSLTGTPTTFAPATHSHPGSAITSAVANAALAANALLVGGRKIWVQSSAPTTGVTDGDVWFEV